MWAGRCAAPGTIMALSKLGRKLFLFIYAKENTLGFFKMGEKPCLKSGAPPLIGIIWKESIGQSKISTNVGSSATVTLMETGVGVGAEFIRTLSNPNRDPLASWANVRPCEHRRNPSHTGWPGPHKFSFTLRVASANTKQVGQWEGILGWPRGEQELPSPALVR